MEPDNRAEAPVPRSAGLRLEFPPDEVTVKAWPIPSKDT